MSPTGLGYTDSTGRFPHPSARGHEYLFISYNYDVNAILASAMKDCTSSSIVEALMRLHGIYKNAGCAPDIYIQDNETSMTKAFVEEKN